MDYAHENNPELDVGWAICLEYWADELPLRGGAEAAHQGGFAGGQTRGVPSLWLASMAAGPPPLTALPNDQCTYEPVTSADEVQV